MAGGILVYALHDDEGNFNKNSLGAISEAAKLAGELDSEAAALVVGDVADDAAASLGSYGAKKVYRSKSVTASSSPSARSCRIRRSSTSATSASPGSSSAA